MASDLFAGAGSAATLAAPITTLAMTANARFIDRRPPGRGASVLAGAGWTAAVAGAGFAVGFGDTRARGATCGLLPFATTGFAGVSGSTFGGSGSGSAGAATTAAGAGAVATGAGAAAGGGALTACAGAEAGADALDEHERHRAADRDPAEHREREPAAAPR